MTETGATGALLIGGPLVVRMLDLWVGAARSVSSMPVWCAGDVAAGTSCSCAAAPERLPATAWCRHCGRPPAAVAMLIVS